MSQEHMGISEWCGAVILHPGAGGAGVDATGVWLLSSQSHCSVFHTQ